MPLDQGGGFGAGYNAPSTAETNLGAAGMTARATCGDWERVSLERTYHTLRLYQELHFLHFILRQCGSAIAVQGECFLFAAAGPPDLEVYFLEQGDGAGEVRRVLEGAHSSAPAGLQRIGIGEIGAGDVGEHSESGVGEKLIHFVLSEDAGAVVAREALDVSK